MGDSVPTLDELIAIIRAFVRERNWEQYNKPSALAVSASIEMGELLELFQWKSDTDVDEALEDEEFISMLEGEIADVMVYLLRICDKAGIDPAEAIAHAGLALGYLEIAHSPLNTGDEYAKAESAALQALKLDPKLAEVHLALAEIYLYATWNYDKSEKYFRQAIELNPSLSVAHYHYAWFLFLHNRQDEAIVEHELAQKYDPFNPLLVGHNGILYAFVGRYNDAFLQVKKSFELQKDCPDAYFALVETHLAMGDVSKAIEVGKKFIKTNPIWKWFLGYVYASTGHKEEATRILDELLAQPANGWNALGIAGILGNLGQMKEAYQWMEYEPHHAWVPFLTVMPMGKPFRKDERFNEFRKRWNLSDPELIPE